MIGSKCYSACDNGYSADSTGTLCIQNCASGETSTATTCTKPRIDNMQSSCCDGEFVPCEAVNGRSFFCYDGGYVFPINQCHCRSDAVTYTKATNNRNWQCPAGTYPNQGSCVASNIQPSSKPVTSVVPSTKPSTGTNVPSRPTIVTVTSSKPSKKPYFRPPSSSAPLTVAPTVKPTTKPTVKPTVKPTTKPTVKPTIKPTMKPTIKPTAKPSAKP